MRTTAMLAGLLLAAAAAAEEEKTVYRMIPTKDLKIVFPENGKVTAPATIATAEELAKSPSVGMAADTIKKQIDFSKEKLVVFAWSGSGGDRLSPQVTVEMKKSIVVFTHTPGKTFDLRQHFVLYSIPKDADLKVVMAR